jgi:hypothetical protein
MTRSEAEEKRRKAVEFLRRISRDDDADRFDAMDADDYTAHKGTELLENPTRRNGTMPRNLSKSDLQAELDDANDYIEELETKLDSIAGIAAGDEDEDSDGNGDGDDQD